MMSAQRQKQEEAVADLQQQLVLCDSLDGFDQIITDGHPAADLVLDLLQTDTQAHLTACTKLHSKISPFSEDYCPLCVSCCQLAFIHRENTE